jgi:hypothetical protein
MKVKVVLFDGSKYDGARLLKEVVYENVRNWSIIGGEQAIKLGEYTDEASRDENNMYLVLDMEDGGRADFCYSHCRFIVYLKNGEKVMLC